MLSGRDALVVSLEGEQVPGVGARAGAWGSDESRVARVGFG
jgi:hypothetical protein